jgi:hypothetical protein
VWTLIEKESTMNHPVPPEDRDQVVESILGLVRDDVRDLIYAGKDPDAVGELLAHTMGSLRALARCLTGAPPKLTAADAEEVRAVIALIPDDVRPLFDAAILTGANPLSYARRIQDMIAGAIVE